MNAMRKQEAIQIDTITRYPYQYCMHFWNNGQGDGFSHLDSWEIFKYTGCPTIDDFGGFNWGNEYAGWMNGYEKYYNAMHNKVEDIVIIDGQQDAYVEMVKQWLYDHGNGTMPGGAMVIMNNDNTWQTSGGWDSTRILYNATGGGHAMCVAGWDDDVVWDYDGNGSITNPGTDVLQWEKGAWRIVNNWGDGLLWLTYRAARANEGEPLFMGITLKQDYKPLITFRVSITHENRRQVQLKAGVAEGLDAKEPDTARLFGSAFNYCGQDFPMCGDNQGNTIEIGLDLTDQLEFVSKDEATYFLVVNCTGGAGKIKDLTLMDYTGPSVKEIPCRQTDVEFESGTTLLSVSRKGPASSVLKNSCRKAAVSEKLDISPNPVSRNSETVMFSLPVSGISHAVLDIFNSRGRSVSSREIEPVEAGGKARIYWNMRQDNRHGFACGVYLVKIRWADNKGGIHELARHLQVID
jgi:hypothetical protein